MRTLSEVTNTLPETAQAAFEIFCPENISLETNEGKICSDIISNAKKLLTTKFGQGYKQERKIWKKAAQLCKLVIEG